MVVAIVLPQTRTEIGTWRLYHYHAFVVLMSKRTVCQPARQEKQRGNIDLSPWWRISPAQPSPQDQASIIISDLSTLYTYATYDTSTTLRRYRDALKISALQTDFVSCNDDDIRASDCAAGFEKHGTPCGNHFCRPQPCVLEPPEFPTRIVQALFNAYRYLYLTFVCSQPGKTRLRKNQSYFGQFTC